MNKSNFYENFEISSEEEKFTDILKRENVRIERIVSSGQSSPADFWYEQEENEWVMIIEGSAVLEFADGEQIEMKKGDFILIHAMVKHRVHSTSKDETTVWLAVFYK